MPSLVTPDKIYMCLRESNLRESALNRLGAASKTYLQAFRIVNWSGWNRLEVGGTMIARSKSVVSLSANPLTADP